MASEAERRTLLFYCVLHCLTTILIFWVIIHHGWRMWKNRNGSKKRTRIASFLMNFDMVALLLFMTHSGFDAVTNILFYVWDEDKESMADIVWDSLCPIYASTRLIIYNFCRFSLFFVWITQIYQSYKGSSFAYPMWIIALMYMLDFVYLILGVSYLNFTWHDAYSENELWCTIDYHWGLLIYFIAFDTFFSLSTLILFIRPLNQLINQGRSGSAAEKRNVSKLLHLIARKTILISITIVSSTVVVPFEVFYGIALVPIDDVINGLSIILMRHIHRDLYKKCICCGKMEECVWWCCYRETAEVMTLVAMPSFSTTKSGNSPRTSSSIASSSDITSKSGNSPRTSSSIASVTEPSKTTSTNANGL